MNIAGNRYNRMRWLKRNGRFTSNVIDNTTSIASSTRIRWEGGGGFVWWGEGANTIEMYDNLYTEVKGWLWKYCEAKQ